VTVTALSTATPAVATTPAVASTALRAVVTGPPQRARTLGIATHAVWLHAGDQVLVISTPDAVRLPIGVVVAAVGRPPLADSAAAGGVVGEGHVIIGDLDLRVARWWEPRPALGRTTSTALRSRLAGLTEAPPAITENRLRGALTAWDPGRLVGAAGGLLGSGGGLTPEGDDYLAGVVAALRCLAPALGHRAAAAMLDAAAPALVEAGERRTTALSASLLRAALRGQVAAPAGALLRAFTGRGDVAAAHARLLGVGHTSGPALAAGMVLGARALVAGGTP
jgi:hypothetical protein